MKILKLLLISLFLLSIFSTKPARAEAVNQEGGVNFQANVLERKITDTINDFTVDGVDYTRPSFKAILGASTDSSSVQSEPPKNNIKFRWQYLLLLLPIAGIGWLVFHRRSLKQWETQKTPDRIRDFWQ